MNINITQNPFILKKDKMGLFLIDFNENYISIHRRAHLFFF